MQLYIHVPFCRSKCHYCSFFSQAISTGGNADEMMQVYVKGLLAELDLWAERLGKLEFTTIFFGGGTPSILPIKAVEQIMAKLSQNFTIAQGAEISLEANPESILELGYAAELTNLGFNRLSLGVQSLNDDTLKALGRPHSVKEAIAAYEVSRMSGFANISLDFIWGLPKQRLRLWLDELKTVVSLKPEHLSCYNLTLDEDTPMARAFERGELELPEEKEQEQMYARSAELLETAGYLHYEISNYARMGYTCRHNLGYWEGKDYIGVGPSASSTLKLKRWVNPANIKAWLEEVQSKRIANDVEHLDIITRVLELIMLRLRTSRGLRLQAYKQLTGRDFIEDNSKLIQALHQKGMMRILNGYLSLTNAGMLVSNSILEFLFTSTRERLSQMDLTTLLPADDAETSGD